MAIVREAIEIEQHPNSMNREAGTCINKVWKPLIWFLKKLSGNDTRTRLCGHTQSLALASKVPEDPASRLLGFCSLSNPSL
jgi:hypothetical protein